MEVKILQHGDPALNRKASVVESAEFDSLVPVAKKAADVMYSTGGCGIAATQIGLDKRFFVIDVEWDPKDGSGKNPIFLFNPTFVPTSDEKVSGVEGCLSVLGVAVRIERYAEIEVEYDDENGEHHKTVMSGLAARCVQHETDHLDGVTIVDRLSGAKKLEAVMKLAAAREKGISPGDPALFVVG